VYFVIDWLRLRRSHRIIGELVGTFPKSTRQDVFSGLPLLLFPEEVTLLLEKKIACLVQCTSLQNPPTESLYKKFQEYRDTLFVQQAECLRENRKKQVIIVCLYIFVLKELQDFVMEYNILLI